MFHVLPAQTTGFCLLCMFWENLLCIVCLNCWFSLVFINENPKLLGFVTSEKARGVRCKRRYGNLVTGRVLTRLEASCLAEVMLQVLHV
ncbi:hypothetical protein L1987_36651 [Smallanthus sonchifolius]|uniref:Uncharacterized protein n=1 Tax=Smallanthus sonchifolius TaxID=185202 RepID=A0ACB9HFE1_9ASTR|nr:hypothetical protein L1987_36651 [Smallanthus sonchifolius]